MSSERATLLTPEEYLEIERRAERKSEYYKGEVFAMAGASRKHGLIVANLVAELRQQLKKKPCEVYPTDMRLRVAPTGLYTYPDVIVVCGEPQFADDQSDTLLNPTLIIEVLSPSTQDYALGRKFEHYRTLPSLTDYLTVAQNRPHTEHRYRQDSHWTLVDYDGITQTISLPSIDAVLSLAEVYDKVEFDR
jgi:Uma2 family endonuclease